MPNRTLPATKLTVKLVRSMTYEEFKACSRLTRRKDGLLLDELRQCFLRTNSGSFVAMIHERATGQLLSWGLASKLWPGKTTVQLWTRRVYRRMGLGTRVMKAIKKALGPGVKFTVFDHDRASTGLFKKVGVLNDS